MNITHLRANHLENPMGCGLTGPILTWTAEAEKGKKLLASRVQISRDQAFSRIVYDSGEQAALSSLGLMPEINLSPRTRYFWRVYAASDQGETGLSETAWFETGKGDEPWQARWIAPAFEEKNTALFTGYASLPEKPVSARLYGVGLGLYEVSLNGQKIGDEVLAPFFNDYANWIQYQVYDVTALLQEGENALSALVGNGWYRGRLAWESREGKLYGDELKLLLELRVQLASGREMVFGTDGSWLCASGPVLENSIYDGEVYDARREINPPAATPVKLTTAPEGKLSARLSPPLKIMDRLPVQQLIHTPAGEWVLDFGQEMTGWVEFDCDLPAGRQVKLQYGEILQEGNFYRENLRTALAEFTFISAGQPSHVRPHFTYYGFRYVKVTGLEPVRPEDFTGCVIHSQMEVTGHFECAHAKVNRLMQNSFWGQIGNFVDVPTDCPQRDERLGWTGDAHVFAPTASFHMYTPAFYDKFLFDMVQEQRDMEGAVPHVVPDVLGRGRMLSGKPRSPHNAGSCGWGDVATGLPWTLYTFFGDKAMLARHYENMKLWTDWIRQQDETNCGGKRLWTCGFHYGDWLALDNPDPKSPFGGTATDYVATAFYYFSASTTAKAARVLGREKEGAEYEKLAEEIKAAFQNAFFAPDGTITQPTQTAMVLALQFGLVPKEHREKLKKALRARIGEKNNHLDTGFIGTYFLCRTLTENGMNDLAYTLLLNEDFPSWLYEVNMGATTVWERWNSVLPNGLVSDTGMNSLNHYAYGAVAEWMYRCMAGINPAEPGFGKVNFMPRPDPRIPWVRAAYDSASGRYESAWQYTETGLHYELTVPFNCSAAFIPEDTAGKWTLNGLPVTFQNGSLPLPPGHYDLVWEKGE